MAGKKDSQEICFVTQGHHSDFVKARRPDMVGKTAGDFVDLEGRVLGQHPGYEAFTIGQRKKLGIALGTPHFVVRIEPDTCRVVLAEKEALAAAGLSAQQANWLIPHERLQQTLDDAHRSGQLRVQIRYNGSPEPASVSVNPNDLELFDVHFDHPVDAVAPGQAAVVFRDNQVLGGGWIR